MTRMINGEDHNTLNSLLSILKMRLSRRKPEILLLQINREKLIDRIKTYKQEPYVDPLSVDSLSERLNIWDRQISSFNLLQRFADSLQNNPFSGERLTLQQMGERLFPAVSRWQLREMFAMVGVDKRRQFYFPVSVKEMDVDGVEQQVLRVLGEGNYVTADTMVEILQAKANTKRYRAAKKELEKRGWVWKRMRFESKVKWVIVAPSV